MKCNAAIFIETCGVEAVTGQWLTVDVLWSALSRSRRLRRVCLKPRDDLGFSDLPDFDFDDFADLSVLAED